MNFLNKCAKISSNFSKKGQAVGIGSVAPYILTFVVVAFIGVIGMSLIGDVKSSATANTHSFNAAAKVEEAGAKVFAWFPTIGTIIGGAVVIGILVTGFMYFMKK